jgi:hypothetical protein
MCQAPFRGATFWDVAHKRERHDEYRATYDDPEFAKVFYEWGYGLGVPHSYSGKSVGHEILASKRRRAGNA